MTHATGDATNFTVYDSAGDNVVITLAEADTLRIDSVCIGSASGVTTMFYSNDATDNEPERRILSVHGTVSHTFDPPFVIPHVATENLVPCLEGTTVLTIGTFTGSLSVA